MNKVVKIFKGSIDKDGFINAIVSTNALDRDKEIVELNAWDLKSYQTSPKLLLDHNWNDVMSHIGESKNIGIDNNVLKSRFEYYHGKGNPKADWAYYIASKGMATYSVSFMPKENGIVEGKAGDNYKRKYTDVELLEISQVSIPSLREAVQADRKILDDEQAMMVCKSYLGDEEFEKELSEIEIPQEEKKETPIEDVILKEGRMVSNANVKTLNDAVNSIQNGLNIITGILESATPAPKAQELKSLDSDDPEVKAMRFVLNNLKGGKHG